ncbi:thioredoxin family protein [Myxococcota bacterium]|nr:thioredoxin family protein [Myxococcota bacterium]
MKHIKVLGKGCMNCKTTLARIDERARKLGVEVELEKVEDMADIVRMGVLSTPAVVIDGVVVHSGGVPSPAAIDGWLR